MRRGSFQTETVRLTNTKRSADTETSGSGIHDHVNAAQEAFRSGRTRPLDWRRRQLAGMRAMLEEQGPAIEAAVHADLGRHPFEAYVSEVAAVLGEVRHAERNLRRWTKDRTVARPLVLAPARAWIRREPVGTVLIMGAWNYPVHLLLMPLAGALAAGNTAVLKPSELAPASSAVLAQCVPRYLDSQAVQVVEGGVAEATALLERQFDHIFFTGSSAVGRSVMTAAARHLTPVTLELGGKCPVWVDDSYPVAQAAKWLVWGKFSNCGQTCVAPDYVLTTPEVAPRLAEEVRREVLSRYGDNPQSSPDYGRIVTERHTRRIAGLLDCGTVFLGGQVDLADRYVAPTVLLDVSLDDPVMQQEIFGPVLPVVPVADHREAGGE